MLRQSARSFRRLSFFVREPSSSSSSLCLYVFLDIIDRACEAQGHLYDITYIGYKTAVLASRLVKNPDSHAREPRSLLRGSSWLCNKINYCRVQWKREYTQCYITSSWPKEAKSSAVVGQMSPGVGFNYSIIIGYKTQRTVLHCKYQPLLFLKNTEFANSSFCFSPDFQAGRKNLNIFLDSHLARAPAEYSRSAK